MTIDCTHAICHSRQAQGVRYGTGFSSEWTVFENGNMILRTGAHDSALLSTRRSTGAYQVLLCPDYFISAQ